MVTAVAQSAAELHKNVPPDWYHASLRINPLQRFWHRRRFRAVQRLLERHPGGCIVDVGCADGVFTNVVYEHALPARIDAVDVLPASVAWAAQHWSGIPQLHFSVADAHALPFASAAADVVTCFEMLEHVHDPDKALCEMHRVLKPGGYALLLVPADTLLFRCIWAVWTKTRGAIWDDTHIQSFRRGSLGGYAERAGFDVEVRHRFLLGMLDLFKVRKPQEA